MNSSVPSTSSTAARKSVIDMTHLEARAFFLKHESYFTSDLPAYINFNSILKKVDRQLSSSPLTTNVLEQAGSYNEVNHTIYSNKDGKYDWRPLQLIHPALYVSLVHAVTEPNKWKQIIDKFTDCNAKPQITCSSLPVMSQSKEKDKAEQIKQWLHNIEQKSLELALDYEYIFHTDIINCYGSIYTHSIAWAIHTKSIAKQKRYNFDLIGNLIDLHLRAMNNGQTNGIPQGSVLMDFIAEVVLDYADRKLSKSLKKIGIEDYTILRYRDDYRIFVNNPQDGERILKSLTEVLIGLSMKLHTTKTFSCNEVIKYSIKQDKLAWNNTMQYDNIKKQLLQIYCHSLQYPNAGSLCAPLDNMNDILPKKKIHSDEKMSIVSIIVDLAVRNPHIIPVCFSILSILMSSPDKCNLSKEMVDKIRKKFKNLPESGLLDIWLQRITMPCMRSVKFSEPVTHVVYEVASQVGDKKYRHNRGKTIWNSDWISSQSLRRDLAASSIVLKRELKKLHPRIQKKEIKMFRLRIYEPIS